MKPSQDTNIPSSIIKENADIFANFLFFNYNKAVRDCEFPKMPMFHQSIRMIQG